MLFLKEFFISIMTVSAMLIILHKIELNRHKPLVASIVPIFLLSCIDALGSSYFFKYSMFVSQGAMIALIMFYYKKPLKKSIAAFCCMLIVYYIILIPFVTLLNLVVSIDFYYFKVAVVVYLLIIALLLYKFLPIDVYYKKYSDLLEKSIFFMLSITLVSYMFSLTSTDTLDTLILMSVIFLAFILSMIALIGSILDTKEQTNMIKAYEQHSHTIAPLLDEIRCKQHDFKNHLATIYSLCQQAPSDTDPIKSYINTLNESFRDSNMLLTMKNKVIGAIICSKAYEAEINNIDFHCDIPPYDVGFQMLDYEYASLLSNLLDNAFEAPIHPSLDRKKVYLKIASSESGNYIEIGNNGIPIEQQQLSKIFRKGFTTKQDGKGHGFGLYSVKKLLSKYGGMIEVSIHEGLTVFKAVLPKTNSF